ncbi:serine/threonine-protein kinase [Streptomyces sp. YIM 130001]|uniref:serine/threonine-protein kinase n=1 Tax=Streptomyces sp. YIM 130001 TaxID=2259644 RepID=UPI000E64BEC6|nr:serine/threonine-protein kinase [Streptomyces sp. YIM 130001]
MEPLRAADPERVGNFVLRGRLGAGGMGEVFLGRSPGARSAAVKVVHPHLARQPEFRRRFRREAAAVRAVSGAFTAPVLGAGPDDELPWIATVYIPGPDLAKAVARTGPLPEESVWVLAAGLAEALAAIQGAGLFHRDLKPANVLLAADGPRVIDFGIAQALEGTVLTGEGTSIGTPGFMSPEQVEGGELGPSSDVFALGAVLAFAATGHEPFGQGPPLGVLHRVVSGEPRLDGLHGPLRSLVTACLSKDRAERPTPAQVLDRIAAHWSPADDLPTASPWHSAMTTLIQSWATTPTTPYTTQSTAPPPRPRPEPDPEPAEPYHARIAADTERSLGADHPDTLQAHHVHAWHLTNIGKYAQAAPIFARVAAKRARVLGPDHGETFRARGNHAWSLQKDGDHTEAADLYAQLAADEARVLGADHEETLQTHHSHAWNLAKAGINAQAAHLFAQVATDRARVLGPDHRETLRARSNHAWALGRDGDHTEAAGLYARLATDRTRILGADHPDTLGTRHNHAWNLGRAGRHTEAAHIMAQVAAAQYHTLGRDHEDTLWSRHMHAWNLGQAGQHTAATHFMAQVVADRTRILGADHPETLRSRRSHAWNLAQIETRKV